MELRDIEIFLTLAEELHFGRTARRLHVSPARISQAIKMQERQIGAALFDRTSRSVRLTPVGEQLRTDLLPIYHGLKAGLDRARLAAQGKTDVLRVGMLPLNAYDLRPYWEAFRARHPHCELSIRTAPFVDPFAGLREGRMDVLVAWLPVEEPDLTVGPELFANQRLLAVAVGHELAGRSSVPLEALGDFQICMAPRIPDYWEDGYTPFHTPGGRPIERGFSITTAEDGLTLVSTGEAVLPFPDHVPRYWGRPDIAWVPMPDLGVIRYAMVWRSEAENDLIRGLVTVVRELGPPTP